ncbi:hypothetical protein Tco_0931394 [Tanacetum coccineum]
MLEHMDTETIGRLLDVFCQVGVTTILANFMLLDVPVDRDVPIIVGKSFMYTCGAIMNTIKKKMPAFDGHTAGTHDYEAESSSRPKRTRGNKTIEEAMLLREQVYAPCIVDWIVLNMMGCAETIEEMLEIKVIEMGGYDKIQRNERWLMSMFEDGNKERYVNVAWVIAKWMKRKGTGTQRESMIECGQFVTRLAQRLHLLNDEALNGFRAPIYCRTLDATTLRELIGPHGRIIIEDSALSFPRYIGIFEYMAGHYGVPLDGAYAPLGYNEGQQKQ